MAAGEDPSTSSTLLRKLWNPENDESAWRLFVERYRPVIYAWCRQAGLQHADAEEVGGRVLSKLAQAMKNFQYDRQRQFRSWLYKVVDNTLKNFWRELKQRPGNRGSGDTQVQERLQEAEAPAEQKGCSGSFGA